MEKRRLGRTGHDSTVVTFGSYSVGKLTQEQADSMGFLERGLQKVARQKPLEDTLASEDMVPFLSWLFDNRKNAATILEQSNFSLTRLSEIAPGYGSKQFTQFYSK